MDMVEPIGQGWVLDNFSLQKFIKKSNFEDKKNKKIWTLSENYLSIMGKYASIYSCAANSSTCLSWW
jgi:hypothetical protein